MKKFIVAMLALCAMAVSFTSCNQADPAKEPIAGKTFRYTQIGEVSGYVTFTFHMNHQVTNVVKEGDNAPITQNALVWAMNADAKNFDIKWAANTINVKTGEPVGGMIAYKGVYDAEKKTILVTLQGTQELVQYLCEEVK